MSNICSHIDKVSGNANVFVDDQFYQFTPKHPKYAELVAAARNNDACGFTRIFKSFEMRFTTNEKYDIKDKIEVAKDFIEYRNQRIEDPAAIAVIKSYATQCDAMKHFIDNMFLNPNWKSVEQLMSFLKHGNFALTADGCFIGYKGVTNEYMDVYTKTISNAIGTTVKMPRKDVVNDPNVACAGGLHVGTYNYARNWAGGSGRVVLVKVNPAHCVSVPFDHDCEKLRCSQYTVLADCENVLPVSVIYSVEGKELDIDNYFADVKSEEAYRRRRPTYTPPVCDDDDWEDDEDECDGCALLCENCDEEFDIEDGFSYCPHCGDELITTCLGYCS